jgi:GNAT superfamily N-acetyltransferase
MPCTSLLARARDLWTDIASTNVAFPSTGLTVVTSPTSKMCPPGWLGLVILGEAAIATAPDDECAERARKLLADLSIAQLRSGEAVARALAPTAVLGPAALAYLAAEDFRPADSAALAAGRSIEELPADHEDLRALERLCSQRDTNEAGIDEITSPVFVIREAHEDNAVIAASGHVGWPRNTAHLSVLTAPSARGRGLARATASAAVAHALAAGMLPQWRARVPESRSVARALGFSELGTQVSVQLDS